MLPQGALLCSGVSYAAFLVRPELHRDEDEGGLSCGSIPTSASSANWTAVQKRGCKYKIAGSTSKKKFYKNGWGFWTGPNFMCNSTKLLRLTTNKATIKSRIAEFEALGDTSIFEGVAWAWRTLSPNTPFADGRAYNAEDNTKILVLLTDGNNNWVQLTNPNRSLHAAQAYYVNQRLGSTQNMSLTQANSHLDNTTKTVCANAKAKGVTIYAVVFSLEGTPIPTAWKDLVIAFASVENGEAQAFLPKTPVSLRKYSRSSPAVSANTIFLSEAAHRRRGPNAKARPKGRASFLPKTLGDR